MSEELNLKGKVALITGAARGIGKAIAEKYIQHGAMVIISDVLEAEGKATVKELGESARFALCDVSNPDQVRDAIDGAVNEFGHLDIMVNNAAYNPGNPAERLTIDEYSVDIFRKTIEVDIVGTFYCSKLAAVQMIKQKSGSIINIASIAGVVPLRKQIGHVVGKAGVIKMGEAMAIELGSHGIRINSISPGSTVTEATRDIFYGTDARSKGVVEQLMKFIPAGRPGEVDDIANAALFLASDMASYINGLNIVVDGGWTCGFVRDF